MGSNAKGKTSFLGNVLTPSFYLVLLTALTTSYHYLSSHHAEVDSYLGGPRVRSFENFETFYKRVYRCERGWSWRTPWDEGPYRMWDRGICPRFTHCIQVCNVQTPEWLRHVSQIFPCAPFIFLSVAIFRFLTPASPAPSCLCFLLPASVHSPKYQAPYPCMYLKPLCPHSPPPWWPPLPPPLLYLREQHADDHNRYLHFFGTTLVLAYAASEPLLLVAATMAVVVGLNVYELTYMVRQKVELGKNLA